MSTFGFLFLLLTYFGPLIFITLAFDFIFLRISYSVYELKKLRDNLTADSLKIVVMYDIACILSSHLKVSTGEM